MATIDRYIVHRTPDQVQTAFQGILKICRSKGLNTVTLIVPQKSGWDQTLVAQFLGPAIAKALLKGQSVNVTDGVNLTLESDSTYRPRSGNQLLVGAHVSLKTMNKLDDSWSAQAVMYLPWTDNEGAEWQATWDPKIVGPSTLNIEPNSLPKPVEEALSELTNVINLGTGLSHPSDKKHAERTIDKLRSDGCSFDPAELRRWAQRNGWSSTAAAELEAVARK